MHCSVCKGIPDNFEKIKNIEDKDEINNDKTVDGSIENNINNHMEIQNENNLDINSIQDLKNNVKCSLHPLARLDLRINETFNTACMICTHPDHKKPVGPKFNMTSLQIEQLYKEK